MTRREQLYPEIKRLREEEGLGWREIGERLGLKRSTVQGYYADPTGEAVRVRKAKNDGVCRGCGARTVSGGSKVPPERCVRCNGLHEREMTRRWIIESMREWADLFGAPPSAVDWTPALARRGPYTAWKAERYEATGRPWPGNAVVQKIFGSWNAGIAAAGFEPLKPSEHWIGHAGMALRREDRAA